MPKSPRQLAPPIRHSRFGRHLLHRRARQIHRPYRTGQNGVSDIFFAHKAMKEVYGDKNKDTTMWQPSASDPNLEAAFLTRFMQYLGVDGRQAENALAKTDPSRRQRNGAYRRQKPDCLWRLRQKLAAHRPCPRPHRTDRRRSKHRTPRLPGSKAPNESNAVTEQNRGCSNAYWAKAKRRNLPNSRN